MYTSYFGLKENPFNLTPDPRYLFLSPNHKEALDHLLYGIDERKGFIAITGGVGTGKTTICRALLSQLDESIKSALIFNPFIREKELLETINQEFGIDLDMKARTKKQHIDRLNQFLLKTFGLGGNAVLLIDEAQNLSRTVLEQIRMLSNLETEKEKLIQIVLVGQSELKELLASSSLRQLNERITVRYELRPLDRKDVQGYVEHRLVVGGGRGNLKFTDGALKAIYESSQGNPRRINAICDRALLAAYARDEFTISKGTVRKAVKHIMGDGASETRIMDWPWKSAKLTTAFMLLLIILAGLSGWAYRGHILNILSPKEKVSVPIPNVKGKDSVPMLKLKEKVSVPIRKRPAASLFLDEQVSLVGLFRLFKEKAGRNNYASDNVHVGLFSFHTKIDNYTLFKKPFRVLLAHPGPSQSPNSYPAGKASDPASSARYLLINQVTAGGAIVMDAAGKDRSVTRGFLQTHWGQEVSWAYLYKNRSFELVMGMSGPSVSKVQGTLKRIGYPVKTTGIYDDSTFHSVMKFQKTLGLMPDGIADLRTKALLYQMLDE
jgi:general secretion pathway protein A